MSLPIAMAAALMASPAPASRPYGTKPPPKSISRKERARRKAKKKAAKKSRKHNRSTR